MQKNPSALPRTKASGDVKTPWADFSGIAGLGPTGASLGTGGGDGSVKESIPDSLQTSSGQGYTSRNGG